MALEGTFQDMSLIDLFHIFVMGHKSGVLVVRQSTFCGVIYVLDGTGRDALVLQLQGRNAIAGGDSAVLHMLRWTEGRFVFRHDLSVAHRPARIAHDWEYFEHAAAHAPQQPCATMSVSPAPAQHSQIASAPSTPSTLLSSAMPPLTPDAALHLMPRSPSSARTIKFNVDEWRVLSWIAQGASVRQIATTTGCELSYILAVVNGLYINGLVTMVSIPQVPLDKPIITTSPHSAYVTNAVLPERRLVEAVMRRIRGV